MKKNTGLQKILFLLIFILFGLTVVAAGAWKSRSQTVNEVSMNSVRGKIVEEYKDDRVLYPGQIKDKKVQVQNTGQADVIVRIMLTKVWGDERLADGKLKINTALSPDIIQIRHNDAFWQYEEADGYYYYKQVLEPGRTTEPLFEHFTIQAYAGNEYKDKRADIIVRMECIQAGESEAAVWGQTLKNLGITEYERTTPEAMITEVDFVDPETGFIFRKNEGDLFAAFKNLLPGESRSQSVELSNSWSDGDVHISLNAVPTDQAHATDETKELIDRLLKDYVQINIMDQEGILIYEGPVWGALDKAVQGNDTMRYPVSLGIFSPGQTKHLTVHLSADAKMDNKYQELSGLVTWEFYAEAEESVDPPIDPPVEPPIEPEKRIASDSDTVAGQKVRPGERITYEITWSNTQEEAADVIIVDELDEGVDFVEADYRGLYDAENHRVTWFLKEAAAGTKGAVRVTVRVSDRAAGTVENEASVQIGNNAAVTTNKVTNPVEPGKEVPEKEKPEEKTPLDRDNVFKKMPLDKDVATGGYVDYAITGFGNDIGRAMKWFSVTDIFPEGLHFVSARVPAFTNGKGITYDITYITNLEGRRTLFQDVAADESFRFNAPELKEGEWIKYLVIDIEEVPEGFGIGDQILYTCRIDKEAKATYLVNEAAFGFDGTGISGQVAPIRIVEVPKTGDGQRTAVYLFLLIAAAGVCGALYRIKKARD